VTAPAPTKTATKPSRIHVEWVGGHRFDAGRPKGPTARIDILAKQRTPLESLQIDVVGERVDTIPRRYKHVTLNFRISGKGIEKEQALKAIELSTNRYCSVRESLRPDLQVDWTVEIA